MATNLIEIKVFVIYIPKYESAKLFDKIITFDS